MADDSVYIDPQQASNGIAQWDAAAGDAQDHWTTKTGEATGFGSPWGSDAAGQQFLANYGGNELMQNSDVAGIFKHLVETGKNVRTAIEASLASDEQQASGVEGVIEPGTAPTR